MIDDRVVIMLSFLSSALYGMETDLVRRVTTGQNLCPKNQCMPPAPSSTVKSWAKGLTPYVREACYIALPPLAACSEVSWSSLFPTAYVPTNATTVDLSVPITASIVMGGLFGLVACCYLCDRACKKCMYRQYKVIEENDRAEMKAAGFVPNQQFLPNCTSVLAIGVDAPPRTYGLNSSIAMSTEKKLIPDTGVYPLLPLMRSQNGNDSSGSSSDD